MMTAVVGSSFELAISQVNAARNSLQLLSGKHGLQTGGPAGGTDRWWWRLLLLHGEQLSNSYVMYVQLEKKIESYCIYTHALHADLRSLMEQTTASQQHHNVVRAKLTISNTYVHRKILSWRAKEIFLTLLLVSHFNLFVPLRLREKKEAVLYVHGRVRVCVCVRERAEI